MDKSNDYKSMIGFWKKLSEEERKEFVKNFAQGYVDINGKEVKDDSLTRLKEEIAKAIKFRERPAIDFGK